MLTASHLLSLFDRLCNAGRRPLRDSIVIRQFSADWAADGLHLGRIFACLVADALNADGVVTLEVDFIFQRILYIDAIIAYGAIF